MKRLLPALLAVLPAALVAQPVSGPQPQLIAQAPQAQNVLPKNTQVFLRLEEPLTTKSGRQKKGDTFALTVARSVVLRDHIVIPRGSRAQGKIIWQTRKGGFGKSGKMELAFEHVEVGDLQIPISGKHREEGEGNSDATVGTFVFLSMLGAGLITGHSAEIPAGKEFVAWTTEDTPVAFPMAESAQALEAKAVGVLAAVPVPKKAASTQSAKRPAPAKNKHVWCVTCR
jgi:hypothetical protein